MVSNKLCLREVYFTSFANIGKNRLICKKNSKKKELAKTPSPVLYPFQLKRVMPNALGLLSVSWHRTRYIRYQRVARYFPMLSSH